MSPSCELLLVEDDVLLARGLERTLLLKGVGVRHASCCALAALLTGPFPIGVFDIELPDGCGIELARLLAARGVVGRVVFYTACTDPQRLARARELGTVFVKSANLHALLELPPRDGEPRTGRLAAQS